MACPFQIPKFQWESAVPLVRKCTFCADRQAIGLAPACAATCPMGALVFGEKEALVKDAWRRIKDHPHKYVPQVYGEKTVGGTSMMYLSSVPFDVIGLQLRRTSNRSRRCSVHSAGPGVDGQRAVHSAGGGRGHPRTVSFQPAPGQG